MEQNEVEKDMRDMGVARYRTKLAKARGKDLETTMPIGRRMLTHYLTPYQQEVDAWALVAKSKPGRKHRAVEYIDLLPTDVICALAARAILDGVAHAKLFTRLCMTVASLVEDEVRYRTLQETDKGLWDTLFRRVSRYHGNATKRRHIVRAMHRVDHVFKPWPQKDKLSVGVVLVDRFAAVTGLVEVVNRTTIFGKTRTEVHASQKCAKLLEESHARDELLAPVYLPCVQEPRPWSSVTAGGFHSKDLHKRVLIKPYDRSYLQELEDHDLGTVLEAVNTLQATPFKINTPVLDVFRHYWESDLEVAGLPTREDEDLPEKPEDIATNEEARKLWRRGAAAVRDRNANTRSERIMLAKILWIADKYKEQPFWFTSQLDWRGRQYPVSLALHPQGPSLCKGLLLFSRGKKIKGATALMWLGVAVANAWGHDKLSFVARMNWVANNAEMLRAVAEDPYSNTEWWDADSPWEALAGAIEITSYADDPHNFVSHLPIHQDATQSGLQILSLLLRDPEGAAATNCTPSAEPKDLYQTVADSVIRQLEDLAKAHNEFAKFWLDFGITRKTVKRPVMTRSYNSSHHSCFEYTREWYQDQSKKNGKELPVGNTWTPCLFLSRLIWKAMEEILTGAMKAMEWFKEVAKVCCEHDIPIRWTTPVGFPVKQRYTKWNSEVVKTRIGDKVRRHNLRVATDQLDGRKMVNGLSPNFVHSLDSSALVATVNIAEAHGVVDFAMVHDSFATLAADSETLSGSIRAAYASMFSEDLLRDFRDEVQAYLPAGVELPELPEYGDLNPSCVIKSSYFFN